MNALPPVDAPNAPNLYDGIDYQHYWEEKDRQHLDRLERAIIHRLLPVQGNRLIDLGCGYARLFDVYKERFSEIVLFDGSESLLRAAQHTTNGKSFYVLGDINHLPFLPETFDAALLVRVLHHLNDPAKCLVEIQRILCGNGTLVMNYSNKRNILRIALYLLKRSSINPFSRETLTMEANFYHHHPTTVSELLNAAAFSKPILRGAGVMDKIAAACGPLGRFVPSGVLLTSLLGTATIAPWIFCKTSAQKSAPLTSASSLANLLACPSCITPVVETRSGFICRHCGRSYPINDGIIDMKYQS